MGRLEDIELKVHEMTPELKKLQAEALKTLNEMKKIMKKARKKGFLDPKDNKKVEFEDIPKLKVAKHLSQQIEDLRKKIKWVEKAAGKEIFDMQKDMGVKIGKLESRLNALNNWADDEHNEIRATVKNDDKECRIQELEASVAKMERNQAKISKYLEYLHSQISCVKTKLDELLTEVE